ncbi:hypothetical protein [Corallococcus carmarthensis]|uniref:Lipoprotein n=1 Tax=Corallococcus carmarthensis TaxID=2316728 RepID=A0A3A8JQ72_9BACT|nr:hypothetical protein [Corallococcus carmarthensis]NOK22684.1 hypothetical protein [Corallococcus carmarthensis]RKG97076.1 hypothetical protein D7X32_33925 [Corallococcus carmarthensis]
MMKHSSPWMLVCAVGLLLGCGGPPEDSPPDVSEGQQDARISQTLIRALPDGTMAQETTFITRAEQRAQLEAREALLRNLGAGVTQQDLDDLAIDGGCAGSSLWLFDQAGRQGNQLCLYKQAGAPQGWLNLGTVIRIWSSPRLLTWAGAVRSLWSGVHPGSLQYCTATLCYSTPYQNFNAYQPMDTITASASQLNWAYLYDP